jgi:hypothetical protein
MAQINQLFQNNSAPALVMLVFFTFLAFLWLLAVQIQFRKIKKRNELFFSGNKIENLEELLIKQTKDIKSLDEDIQELYNISNSINSLAFKGIHKVGLIRFNPFKDVGGDQSFAIALLNGKNNGIVISSLYTREGTRIYSKSILLGKSDKHPLTEEEKKAIKIAMNSSKVIQ